MNGTELKKRIFIFLAFISLTGHIISLVLLLFEIISYVIFTIIFSTLFILLIMVVLLLYNIILKSKDLLYVYGVPKLEERILRITTQLPRTKEEIMRWLNNFLLSEQEFALRLLEHFRYIKRDDLIDICNKIYTNLIEKVSELDIKPKIPEDLFFINFGKEAKSDKLMSYHFRQALGTQLSDTNFVNLFEPEIDPPKNKVLIYIDDLSGTGHQFLSDWEKFNENLKKKWHDKHTSFTKFNKFVFLPIFITKIAKNEIEQLPYFIIVYLSHHLLTEKHMALKPESKIFNEKEMKIATEIFYNYGKQLYPKGPLGYGNLGLLISFFYNTPNNTLPIIWQKSPSEFCNSTLKWEPLFPRYESI